MSVLDFATWAGWNAGRGKRGPALVRPETLEAIHRPRISTGKLPQTAPGTPQEGQYALGWGVLKFDWTTRPVLEHNGSNTMNLAKILVDPEGDLGVVVMTNFPGEGAETATRIALENLYRRYAGARAL
jgi:CubicO group peptidase (beta-lactamase class C family)